MKIRQKMAVLAALFIIINGLPAFTVKAENFSPKDSFDAFLPDEAPAFDACIEWSPQGYRAMGTFTEFPPDISLVQPMYSLDGETYHACPINWDLHWIGSEDAATLSSLQNQVCLFGNQEPLKSYLAGELDRFYLKLSLTRENGITYETQAAVIDRGGAQSMPEEYTAIATFASSMRVREMNPFYCYGKYQLTVSTDASPEEIAAFLPDTVPIEIQFQKEGIHIAQGIVDCPIRWKPLSLPRLTAGESVTISDAAEEIVVPGDTRVSTPLGVFSLREPLRLEQDYVTDEIRLVLNVVPENASPTGALSRENAGLEMVFDLKPTGATAIQAYTFTMDDTDWTELPSVSFLEAVNAQPSTASSGYTFVIGETQEPFRSCLATRDEPEPFFVGIKITGGVYDGQQLILPWPHTYEIPLQLPALLGAGGNEDNAGANNKDDSTPQGQRPNLSLDSGDKPDTSSDNKAPVSDGIPASAPTPIVTKSAASHNIKESYLEKAPEADSKTDTRDQTAESKDLPSEALLSAALISADREAASILQEKPERGTQGHGAALFAAAAVIAGVCITGICMAAAAGQTTVKALFTQTAKKSLHILRRFLPRK